VGTFLFLSTFEKTPFFEINAHLFIERDKEFKIIWQISLAFPFDY
jgi:hypothetical protein